MPLNLLEPLGIKKKPKGETRELQVDDLTEPAPETDVVIRRWYPVVGFFVTVYLIWLMVYHIHQVSISFWQIPIVMVSFAWLVLTIMSAHFNRPVKGAIPKLPTAVIIPSRNEGILMLWKMFWSLHRQVYLPEVVVFIENGESNGLALQVFKKWAPIARPFIGNLEFIGRDEAGKRSAQVVGFAFLNQHYPHIKVAVTVDGDTRLSPMAIAELLKPFHDAEVTSVAGLLLGENYSRNWLTRIVNLGFVSSFQNGRAAWSAFGSVVVNCGGLAAYQMWAVMKHLDEYGTQTLFGKEVNSGDDRMLTSFSVLEGRTVYQETAVAYTLHPIDMKHLTGQRGRWWRSFWWGGFWAVKRFPVTKAAWWLVLSQFITFMLYAVVFPYVLIIEPVRDMHFPWQFFAYIVGLSYLRSARTLKVKRPDQSTTNQILEYIFVSPLVTILNLWLCTVLQWWGLFTFWMTNWVTRDKVQANSRTEVPVG